MRKIMATGVLVAAAITSISVAAPAMATTHKSGCYTRHYATKYHPAHTVPAHYTAKRHRYVPAHVVQAHTTMAHSITICY